MNCTVYDPAGRLGMVNVPPAVVLAEPDPPPFVADALTQIWASPMPLLDVTVPEMAPSATRAALTFGVVAPPATETGLAVAAVGWLLYHCCWKPAGVKQSVNCTV